MKWRITLSLTDADNGAILVDNDEQVVLSSFVADAKKIGNLKLAKLLCRGLRLVGEVERVVYKRLKMGMLSDFPRVFGESFARLIEIQESSKDDKDTVL